MKNSELKKQWLKHYQSSSNQLGKMEKVKGVVSAFNANIDAVIKISGKKLEKLIEKEAIDIHSIMGAGEKSIKSREDAIRGIMKCFSAGIAEEWLIEDVEVFHWLNKTIGYDKMQMGGQGGIVANVMAVCGVSQVYVHTASSPKEQSELFLNLENLKNVDENGTIKKAFDVSRNEDLPLIHWIIEFDKDDIIKIGSKTITCPKANRFIATYDPLNFRLAIDENFHNAMSSEQVNADYIILSGYQMLKDQLPAGESGMQRIDESVEKIALWGKNKAEQILHLEIASTQNTIIRKYLVDELATKADSIGFNERELIDILEVIGEAELAKACDENTNSKNLFKGMLKVYAYTSCPRMQLHMFGLYITLQKKGFQISPMQNRKGMQLAANIAASKAGTGALDAHDVLLWSAGKEVADEGLNELQGLSEIVSELLGENKLMEEGVFVNDELEVIAVPTIIIDKPITLVGMGDTISSVSLVGAQ